MSHLIREAAVVLFFLIGAFLYMVNDWEMHQKLAEILVH